MERHAIKGELRLENKARQQLVQIAFSPCEPRSRVVKAKVLLAYAGGSRIPMIAKYQQISRARVLRIIDRAIAQGAVESLGEARGRKPGFGRPPEAISWLVALAEQPPSVCGCPVEVWDMKTLLQHAREVGPKVGHPSLADLTRVSAYRYFSSQGKPFRAR